MSHHCPKSLYCTAPQYCTVLHYIPGCASSHPTRTPCSVTPYLPPPPPHLHRIVKLGEHSYTLHYTDKAGVALTMNCSLIMMATGRKAKTGGLGLEVGWGNGLV